MSVRSALITVAAVICIPAGLVTLPLKADSTLQLSWVRNLNSTPWGYTKSKDPNKYGLKGTVERFELRKGDCTRNEREDDCNSNQERTELVELNRPVFPLNGEVWYRWRMYFPENYKIIYPAKTYHIRFFEKDENLTWSFEIGSTGVFWLGNYVSDKSDYYPLLDEEELLSQWHEFIVHAKWRPDHGFFRVWVNSVWKVDYVGPTCLDCSTRFGYGIIRSGLQKYHQSYPESELPTQVVYYAGLEKSTSGIGYPGQVPSQKTNKTTETQPSITLKPVLIIETSAQKRSDPGQTEENKGDPVVSNRN